MAREIPKRGAVVREFGLESVTSDAVCPTPRTAVTTWATRIV
jgi:hypothetical protein